MSAVSKSARMRKTDRRPAGIVRGTLFSGRTQDRVSNFGILKELLDDWYRNGRLDGALIFPVCASLT
jgi:hypothetical protein